MWPHEYSNAAAPRFLNAALHAMTSVTRLRGLMLYAQMQKIRVIAAHDVGMAVVDADTCVFRRRLMS
eukprot:1226716-Karenia_brevis.AAC.1